MHILREGCPKSMRMAQASTALFECMRAASGVHLSLVSHWLSSALGLAGTQVLGEARGLFGQRDADLYAAFEGLLHLHLPGL